MNMNNDFDREISFDIVEPLGVITSYSTGWCKELNLVSWNGGTPKYDIRDWAPDHERMSRGVTLHEKEMRTVIELLRRRNRRRPAEHQREAEARRQADAQDAHELQEMEDMHRLECSAPDCCGEQSCMEESA